MTSITYTGVLVVGAGPAGLTLAADLLRRNVSVRLIDQAGSPAPTSRATSLTPRTLEVLDDLGIAQELLDTGIRIRTAEAYQGQNRAFRLTFPETGQTRYPFLLNNSQRQTEDLMTERVRALGGTVERERRLIGLRQDRKGVVALIDGPAGPEEIHAKWLIGADGGRSTVRNTLGIPFEGKTGTLEETIVLGDVHIDWNLPSDRLYSWFNEDGALLAFPFREPGRWRITAALSPAEEADGRFIEDSIERFTELYQRRTGDTTSRLTDMQGFSVYRVNQRVVDHYRRGRVVLMGDAAHVHTPAGGLGMNTGIQDAYSLGWRLAIAVQRGDDAAIESYERERRPVALALLSSTGNLQRLWSIRDRRVQHVRDSALQIVLNLGPVRRAFFAGAGQLNVTYRARSRIGRRSGPRVGDRIPDVRVAHGNTEQSWLHEHLRGTQPVLIVLAGDRISNRGVDDRLTALAHDAQRRSVTLLYVEAPGVDHAERGGVTTVVDTHGDLHRRFHARTARSIVVRPDKHIAAISTAHDSAILALAESLTHRPETMSEFPRRA
ncbi:FAD-dependent monooxygenase [Microbacterium sp. DT81.1]|uniref:FAD-dependent monooxygenase n=1 Tax=Microbacterium sp. DT81.1 TaxID=3393413 RepID=UPI003CFAC46B